MKSTDETGRKNSGLWAMVVLGSGLLLLSLYGAGRILNESDIGVVQVYPENYCSCCEDWITYLEREGLDIEVLRNSVDEARRRHSVPVHLQTCHTAVVAGYVIEGHVPADDIRRLIKQRPDVAGLVVPGMPFGSPGMERPGYGGTYQVLALGHDGSVKVFSEHEVQ